ncbi:MAG: TonB-dependent receptor [Pseudomonadota bacterium]
MRKTQFKDRITISRNVILASAGCVCAVGFGGPLTANAQETAVRSSSDLIVVTATRREESLQDVPLAITAIDGNTLTRIGAEDITDFALRVPGLSFSRKGVGETRFSIRGLTSFAGTDAEFPMVGYYVDEVAISDNDAPDIALSDIKRIEVLRGPQGTLYGEGSMGGTIRIITNQPDPDEFEASLQTELSVPKGGSPAWEVSGVMNVPLGRNVALRVSGLALDNGGFIDNAARNETDANAYDRLAGRAVLAWSPVPELTITAMGSLQAINTGIRPQVFPSEVSGLTPPLLTEFGETIGFRQVDENTQDDIALGSVTINYDLGFAEFVSATSIYNRDQLLVTGEPNTARVVEAGFAPLAAGFGVDPFFLTNGVRVDIDSKRDTFIQEIRLVSKASEIFKWTLGGYYRDRDLANVIFTSAEDVVPFVAPFNPNYGGELQFTNDATNFEQYAIFGEVGIRPINRLELTLGARWFDETVTGEQVIGVGDFTAIDPGTGFPLPTFGVVTPITLPTLQTNESDLLWKAGLAYNVGENILAYASFAEGFRPGGVNSRFNPAAPAEESPRSFASDAATTYEGGIKSTLLNGRMQFNVAGYFTKLKDAQFFDPRDPSFQVIRNAGEAEILGFELETTLNLTSDLQVGGHLSLIDASFSENALPLTANPGVFLIAENQDIPLARDVSLGLFFDYRRPVFNGTFDLLASADIFYASDTVSSTVRPETDTNGLFTVFDSFILANARLGVSKNWFEATVFVDNITDQFIEFGGFTSRGISRNSPRTYGLRLTARY